MQTGQNLDQLNTIQQSPVIIPANQAADMINEFLKHPSNDQVVENAQIPSTQGVQVNTLISLVSSQNMAQLPQL